MPQLHSYPLINHDSLTSTSVTIVWNAWNPANGDTGDGPVIGYNIYDEVTMTLLLSVRTTGETTYTRNIVGLEPNTYYKLIVKPLREGLGGEGFASGWVEVISPAHSTTPTASQSTARKATTEELPMQSTTTKIITEKLPTQSTMHTTREKLAPPSETTSPANKQPPLSTSTMNATPTVKVSGGKY